MYLFGSIHSFFVLGMVFLGSLFWIDYRFQFAPFLVAAKLQEEVGGLDFGQESVQEEGNMRRNVGGGRIIEFISGTIQRDGEEKEIEEENSRKE